MQKKLQQQNLPVVTFSLSLFPICSVLARMQAFWQTQWWLFPICSVLARMQVFWQTQWWLYRITFSRQNSSTSLFHNGYHGKRGCR
jgi:hypothetical protein